MKDRLNYGHWRELDAHLVWIYEGRPIRMSGRFEHQYLSAWLITRGSLEIEGPSPRRVEAGHWVFGPHQNFGRVFSSDAEIVSIKFALRWPNGTMLFEPEQPVIVAAKDVPSLEQQARDLLALVGAMGFESNHMMQFESLEYQAYLELHQQFEVWLKAYLSVMQQAGESIRLLRREDDRVLQTQQILERHPLSADMDFKALASGLGLSFGHADALFAANFGMTMRAYLDQRRYRAAVHWLEASSKPVKLIAYELGFQDATALTHWFKKKSGLAPSHYRKQRASNG